MKKIKYLFASLFIMAQTGTALASPLSDKAGETATSAGLKAANIVQYIGLILKIFIGLTGVLFLIMMIWAGITWMTAGGDSAKVEAAKKRIFQAIIGLALIIASYSIITFFFEHMAVDWVG